MPLKVIESRKEFDWSVNKPVEFRPYIKDIAGRRRMFFLGTISAIREDSNNFDGSATPDLALVDSEYRDVVWIDVKHPSQWDKTVYDQLNEAWRSSEGIGKYFLEETKQIDAVPQPIDSIKPMSNDELLKQLQEEKKVLEIEKLKKEIDSLKAASK